MTQTDLYFRAYLDYKTALQKDRETSTLRAALVQAEQAEHIASVRAVCEIENDWVDAVERGLIYIGRSIDEERQFILSQGEVQPIEKIKRVSKESVEHLARHSNLIMHEQKSADDIVPDKLYTVERLSNYAVYENRFLFMLLNMVKDFVSVRYNAIVRLTNTYHGKLSLDKAVSLGKHRLRYRLELDDEREDDPVMRANNNVRETLERMEIILRTVHYYLNTPLMTEVAKADKLKPPITKTNPLRMDKNLKETVVLYEFLMAYEKDGYTITQEEQLLDPRKGDVADELVHPALLAAFLTYESTLALKDELLRRYQEEETRRRAEELREVEAQLSSIRDRMREAGWTERYIALLEKKNSLLERENERVTQLRSRMEELEGLNNALHEQIAAHAAELERIGEAHAREISDYQARLDEQRQKLAEEMTERANERSRLEEQRRAELAKLREETDALLAERDGRYLEKSREAEDLTERLARLTKQKALNDARLNGLRQQYGLLSPMDDFSSEEAFTELEDELEALYELVRGEWKNAKEILRRNFLHDLKDIISGKKRKAAAAKKAEVLPEEDEAAAAHEAPEQVAAEPAEQDGGENALAEGEQRNEETRRT